jgi:hypothetical protein
MLVSYGWIEEDTVSSLDAIAACLKRPQASNIIIFIFFSIFVFFYRFI